MQIAICDDDKGCCSQIEKWLKTYRATEKLEIKLNIYYDAERLIKELRSGRCFDVIFLDIELPELSGIEVGREIRHYLENDFINIVFISGKTQYCMDLFELEPLNFHHKPLVEEQIIADVEKIAGRMSRQQKILRYQDMGIEKAILLKEIVYVEATGKLLEVTTVSGKKISIRDTLIHLDQLFFDYYLCQCHRSYLINMSQVDKYQERCFYMKNGAVIPVGKKYAETAKKAWVDFSLEVR